MFLSVFDIFKRGIGPSSSHTMGPMVAAARFLADLRDCPFTIAGVGASLHGSLAFTGRGHATDRAVILGLSGLTPVTCDPETAEPLLAEVTARRQVTPEGLPPLAFDPANDLVFDYGPPLPGHSNGLRFWALDGQGDRVLQRTYYSIGGGFVLSEDELEGARADEDAATSPAAVPHPFTSAEEMLSMAASSGLTIAQMKRANELASMSAGELDRGLEELARSMHDCIDRGLAAEGILPGGLGVRRRAGTIHRALLAEQGRNLTAPHTVNDWIATYAMAVNEENAAGGQVVTAPTNGAAGVLPAVLRYWLDFVPQATPARSAEFLLTAAAIGGIIKTNASISGAECGCQAEVGSAAAMAAAGLCAVLGGSAAQVENAAEIALEHHLGMTCDPVRGLVQVPCIERNGLGAIKAVSAASLSLRGDGAHLVPLDAAIETMRQTGRDMSEKYKETSLGGLAVNVPNC
ncbi:L-serine ammonia-lyase [Brevirhabdus pacifica]|uniref:L-serine dehydratase n=1 Tax=Brevirhabdus pacifica TaxID=1267768 RepID=A0A1U7DH49_9RHOB|nr:L-serine ammonia-lyase [Brevirhabdus pacifica]APX89320.1 L-serine ammonia-lyase [Brevirhabdus pacifica]OWU76652.1 serine dehydratase [Loktanella sp. 22II-4b]PJJ86058.1 L-serine ammonia-lyase [Brevirhabdus pacifica]